MDRIDAQRWIRALLPTRARTAAKVAIRGMRRRTHAGDLVECPICDGRFGSFLERRHRQNAQCPGCGSLVRHRILWLYLRDQILRRDGSIRLLHLAPEQGIERRIRAMPSVAYTCADADAALAADQVDIVRMPYADGAFDVVICSHVLEHVPDDLAAIGELRRILAPGGSAIIVVPVKGERTEEFLDGSPERAGADGHVRHGAHGHVRSIGADYPDRLRAGGFVVETVDYGASLPEADRARYGLIPSEPLFECRRAVLSLVAAVANSVIDLATGGLSAAA